MKDKGSDMREKLGDDVGAEGVEQAITDEETTCYRDLIEHSRDLICTHDLEGRILFVNSAAVKISGYDLNSFLKKNIRDFLAPEFRDEFDYYIASILNEGFAEGFMQVQTREGERRIWEYHNTLRTEGVRTPIVRGMAHDVTNLLRAEAQVKRLNKDLEQRVSELQTLLDVIPIGIGISEDPECKRIKVNPYFARALGVTPGANASLSAPSEEKPRTFKVYREGREMASDELPMQYASARGVVVSEVEVDVVHDDGSVVKLLEYAAPLFDEQGATRGCIGAFVDITDRKRAEEALKRSEEYYRGLFENAHDAIIILDPESELVLDANRRACEVYGFSRAEFVGSSLEKVSRNPGKGRLRIQETLTLGLCHHFETIQYRKDGTEMFLDINASVVDYQGKPAILSINRDITERKLAEKEREQLLVRERLARTEAEAASRAKDEFLATVSHELRTPLTAILGWATMLRLRKHDEVIGAQGLEAIERNAKIQAQIVEDLLDASRIISGKLNINVQSTDLVSVIKAAFDVVRPAADAKNIHVHMGIDASIDRVQGDPDRLQQVVWNLLSNAVKFTPDGGRVEVRLERADCYAQITVSDSGKGIDPEFLPYVFDRFRQEDSSINRRHGGLGLGLAIVRYLVEMHGGNVQAESPGEGLGASFTVRLPLRPVSASAGLQTTEPGHLRSRIEDFVSPNDRYPDLLGLQVLVVDDDVETLLMLSTMLDRYGIKVLACASAAQALEVLEQNSADLLISDIAMPNENGYEFISKVRSLETLQKRNIPAVALTAHVRIEDRIRALTAGYQMFIAKPIEIDDLLAAIATLAAGDKDRSVGRAQMRMRPGS
jgi:PAS domain S-box-containing protein